MKILGEICRKYKITPEEFSSDESVQWLKIDNSKSWPSKNIEIVKKYLSERKIDYCGTARWMVDLVPNRT